MPDFDFFTRSAVAIAGAIRNSADNRTAVFNTLASVPVWRERYLNYLVYSAVGKISQKKIHFVLTVWIQIVYAVSITLIRETTSWVAEQNQLIQECS
ncbi:MAG: hypothetical protein ACI92B_001475 [Marinobacter maritimus]|jgi:hypothetical protein